MIVWIIKIGDPAPLDDTQRPWRSASLALEMANASHDVTLWNSSFNHYQKTFIDTETTIIHPKKNLKLILIKSIGYTKNVSVRRFRDYRSVAKQFLTIAEEQPKPDIIVSAVPSHDFAYRSAQFAKKHNVPLVIDVSDLWPDVFLTVFKNSFLKRIGAVLLSAEFKKLEYACKTATNLVAISETYMNYALHHGKRNQTEGDRIFHLGGAPIDGMSRDKVNYSDGVKEIIYVGSFGKTYELEIMVKAAHYFQRNKIKDVRFVLIGGGEQEEALKENSKTLKNIEFTGWLNLEEIQTRMKQAYLAVVPYKAGAPQCLPYKAFDYFSAGLPVVSSLVNTDMEYKIEEYNLGKSYQPGDVDAMIQYCIWYIDHPNERNETAVRVYDFFENQGDSNRIYEEYRQYLVSIVENGK